MRAELQLAENAPWKLRFRAPGIYASQIAPLRPQRGLIASNQSGTLQWYAWDVPSNRLQQITHTPGGHSSFLTLSPDGKCVYYLDDDQGNEIGHYVRMSIEGSDPQDITPDLSPYSAPGFAISHTGNRIGLLAAHDNSFHVYAIDVAEVGRLGELRKLYASSRLLSGTLLSQDGNLLTIMSTERTGTPQYALLTLDANSGETIAELWDGDENSLSMIVPSRVAGDPRLLATTTRTGIESLLIWNPRTGERTDLTFDNIEGAVRAHDWSPDGKRIIFHTFNSAVQQLYLHDLSSGETIPVQGLEGTSYQTYFSPQGEEIFCHWTNANQPASLIALSPQTGEKLRTVILAGEAPPGREWQSISFPSSDGQNIQAWLGVPEGAGPFPTIIETHGGPTAVQTDIFAPGAQAWLDHGFAYLTINYRGSTTFGRDFEQKIWGQPGHWETEDLVAARHWLVEQKIAIPDAILLTGWSYGGYLTLLGLGKAPELWAGGMAGIAITDWTMSYEDSAESLRGYQVALFGGTPDEKPEQYRISSPISYAEDVSAPVLIIQGRNDTRTPARPVQVYERRMKELGKEIDVHWYDTGHAGSFTSIEEGIRHQELMLRFAHRVLG